jgi:hypothetical protein
MAAHHVSLTISGDRVVAVCPPPPETLSEALINLCDRVQGLLRDPKGQELMRHLPEQCAKIELALADARSLLRDEGTGSSA